MTDLTKYTTKEELFDFIHQNKSLLISEKKYEVKKADSVCFIPSVISDRYASKSSSDELMKKSSINAKVVINTTKLFDSHRDVHIDGLWRKTLSEQRNTYHLQEHKMAFNSIISDNVSASTQLYLWKELGYNFEGNTEALVFDSIIEKKRNPFMFEQYANGWVKNHSVGMRYVQLYLAINSDSSEYKEEKEVWDEYFKVIANKQTALDEGFFWAVREAKLIEGSAVPIGSNWATPTQEVKSIEPSQDTQLNNSGPEIPPANRFKSIISKLN